MDEAERTERHEAARAELENAAADRGVRVKVLGEGRFWLSGATRRVLETVAKASEHYGEHFTIAANGEIRETVLTREEA